MARLALIILSTYFFASDFLAGAVVLTSKRLPLSISASSDISSTEIFIDADDNTFIVVEVEGFRGENHYEDEFLYMNDSLIDLEQYDGIWDKFLKDGHFHLAFKKNDTIFIYKVPDDIGLVSRIDTKDFLSTPLRFRNIDNERIIPVSGLGNSHYMLIYRKRLPVNPVEFLVNFFSGGHGIGYAKPFLIEIQDDKPAKPRKLRYGRKIDESYYIKKVVQHEDFVHFLGLRMQEERDWGPEKMESKPEILHHAAYNLEKKKVVNTHTICTKIPWAEIDKNILSFYGPLSMDALSNNVFVVFSWIEERIKPRPIPIKDINSTIFYWQYSNGIAIDAEKIGDGFLPLVRVDSSGSVHILWVDKNASLIHKVKRNGKWGNYSILVKNLEVDYSVIVRGSVTAEFDSADNLHIVYPSGGTLVHSILKVD